MKTTIMKMIVVAALSFNGAALAAEEVVGKVQAPAAKPVMPALAVPPAAATPPAPMREPKPPSKAPAHAKPAKAKPPRSKNLDLRQCLELKTDAEIAKCAGE